MYFNISYVQIKTYFGFWSCPHHDQIYRLRIIFLNLAWSSACPPLKTKIYLMVLPSPQHAHMYNCPHHDQLYTLRLISESGLLPTMTTYMQKEYEAALELEQKPALNEVSEK